MDLNVALALIGALTLLLGLAPGLMRGRVYPLSEPMLATGLGILIGPLVWDVLRLEAWGDPLRILEQVARLTDAFAGMAAALYLPQHYLQRHARSMVVLLGPGMFFMWLTGGLLVYALLDLSLWTALLIGAVIAPIDPVVSSTILTGKTAERNIPARLRHRLTAEAGANDAVAYPLVFLAILVIEHPPTAALTEWLTRTVLWEVGAAIVIGALIGYAAGWIQAWSETKDYMEKTSLLTVTVALTAVVLGAVKLVGGNGIVAAFAAGAAFNRKFGGEDETKMADMQQSMRRLFFFPAFVFFGMVLPWDAWTALGWTALALPVLVLLLRRLPAMLVLRPFQRRANTLFGGWFGPIGIASLFYALLAVRTTGAEVVWVVGSLVIFASILAHGATSTPFTKLYGKREGEQGKG